VSIRAIRGHLYSRRARRDAVFRYTSPIMLTRCPNPKCHLEFDVPDEREGKNGPCPNCGQVITFRSLAILNEIQRQHAKREATVPQTIDLQNGALPNFSAAMEDIRSLWNFGSMFRTADGAGFGALYLCGITGCPPDKKLAKTSLGAEDHVPWLHANNALDVLPVLKQRGVQIVALEKNDTSVLLDEALEKKRIRTPMCLIAGNEVAGVSAEALALSDLVVHLPMHGVKVSLNVAVAFGIAAYAIRTRVGI
jgi:23S rRNA (guanosine2251-2'-O)-methyltransferase